MGFFDSFSENLASAGRALGSKTKSVAESTKLSFQITQEENKLKSAYAALGEAFYQANKDTMPEDLQFLADGVKESLDRLAELTSSKQEAAGQKTCSVCGAAMDKDALFCGKCGAPAAAPKEEPEISEPEEEPVEETPEPGVCPHCSAPVKEGLLYCPSCGEKL